MNSGSTFTCDYRDFAVCEDKDILLSSIPTGCCGSSLQRWLSFVDETARLCSRSLGGSPRIVGSECFPFTRGLAMTLEYL